MALRVAAFDLDGVLALPSIVGALRRSEEALALPRDFLLGAFQTEVPEGPTEQLMKGKITFSQWVPLMDESYRKSSKACGASLPENFSISQVFSQAMAARSINRPMLQAAIALKKKGFKTCIVTNNWLDDGDKRGNLAQMMCELSQHFDFLIESCQVGMIKPEPQIYKFVLDTLKAKPNEVVFLDDFGSNLKPARDMGMVTILVHNTASALRELEKVTETQFPEAPLPVRCNPNDVSHGYVTVKTEIEEYAMELLCKEMVTFLDKLGIPQAVFIGHDWAGVLVWNMALFHPERVRAVASLNTPFMPPDPDVSPMKVIRSIPVFNYQLYFQEPGVAEAELEKNMSRTFKSFFRASDEMGFLTVHKATEMGGILVNTPEDPKLSKITTEEEIEFYVQQFKKSGFRGPLNWYRNTERNWKWSCKGLGRKILVPALMVTAEKDVVLRPEMSKNMETWIPFLKRGHIEDCGHWTQIEKPAEVNQILIKWLQTEVQNPSVTSKI
ncbi:bifunctional epoxide hydrolase 2 [Mus pahari]|uniref:bifunctional epoxide hydrolase 2 n=1 Tax=Mus pahari TaxID=10093 RepID=UPI001114D250|nr:bifunctional epoxide hydrolase 2 [Mus pahari]